MSRYFLKPIRPHFISLGLIFWLSAAVFPARADTLESVTAALSSTGQFELLVSWDEVRLVDGQTRTVHGRQLRETATGREYTLYFDDQGRALPDPFVAENQLQWADQTPVEAPAENTPAAPARRLEKTTAAYGPLELLEPADQVRLDPPNLAKVLQEDDQPNDQAERPRRIGIRRTLPARIRVTANAKPSKAWRRLKDGGRLYAVSIESPDAKAMRLHLENVRLPKGSSIRVYNRDAPEEVCGPYDAAYLQGRIDLWTESVFGSRVVLECYAAPGTDRSALSFEIGEITHRYADILGDGPTAKVGNCHNDVVCFPAWANTAAAVAGIGSVGDAGELFCTGSLVVDTVATSIIQYFMTANHCIGNSTEANSSEFYWFYQKSHCGSGSAPNPATVPRTGGGADFLAGSSFFNLDFALLRVRNPLPGGVVYAGWTTFTPAVGSAITGIHHPDGSYKRISFGSLIGFDGNFQVVVWSDGVTEPGSSGSPLYNSTQQYLGQLSYGDSACSLQNGQDGYGRFSLAYPILKTWLNPGNLPPPNANSAVLSTFVIDDPRDYDGDNRADLAVYHPASGNWYILQSQSGTTRIQNWGNSASIPVPGDYDGDGLTDIAYFQPANGNWYIWQSSTSSARIQNWGWSATTPVPGDYDFDGRTDIAVFYPLSGTWYILQSGSGTLRLQQWGWSATVPCPSDFDGDGKTDIAVYFPATGNWYIQQSSSGTLRLVQWGYSATRPVPGPYDTDPNSDIAVCEPISGAWYILRSTDSGLSSYNVGTFTTPVPADYDGDNRYDAAGFHLSTANWFIQKTTGGNVQQQFGWSATKPAGAR